MIRLHDGASSKAGPWRPPAIATLPDEQITAKFLKATEAVLSRADAAALGQAVQRLEADEPFARFIDYVLAPAG